METKDLEKGRFEALFYGSDTPMVIFKGPDAIVEMFNDKYHEIYRRRDLLGKSLFDAVEELKHSQFPIILKKVYETGENYFSREGVVHILNPKSGELEERFFDTTFSRIDFNDHEYRILATPREVTERVRYRQLLEHSLRELEEEREFRELFISALGHDLRTPLAILKLSAEVLMRREKTFDEIKAMSVKMVESVNNTDKMIRDLLDADRIRAGQWLNICTEEDCLKEIVMEYIETLSRIYPSRVIFKSEENDFHGTWDRIAIQRIIENLVSNAIKYGEPESCVTVELNGTEEFVQFSVHNQGTPIPENEIDNIFKKHRQVQSVTTSGKTGWGIGLALVKALTEAHGGSVKVESSYEKGTVFTVNLNRAFETH